MPGPIELEFKPVTQLGLPGRDYRGARLEVLFEPGDSVQAGAAIMRDARRPEICIAAPGSGRISRVERGARRRLLALHIEADSDLDPLEFKPPAISDRAALRSFMQASGSWCGLRTRPFGNIPDPSATPAAILVTAMDTEPAVTLAASVIETFAAEFSAAVDALAGISDAPLYICHAPDYRPRVEPASGALCRSFTGNAMAGLPGRHIQALCPIGFAGGAVWHLGYQQAIALGHLLLHGKPWQQRALWLGGDAVARPRGLLVPAGAAIDELLQGETDGAAAQLFDGSALCGSRMQPGQRFLGACQTQLTVLRGQAEIAAPSGSGALIPGDWLEAQAPPGIYAVPLLRALQLGDAERARELGALELVEEDLEPLSRACVSNADYGLLLRRVLDQLESLH